MADKTLFQKIINGDLPGYVPYQDDTTAALIALEGHVLVVPKEAYRDIHDLPEDIAADLMKTTVKIAKAVKQATNCEGINLVQSNGVVAGQEVFHFHMHIKPRFTDDDVTLSWDTDTKSESDRENLAEALKAALT